MRWSLFKIAAHNWSRHKCARLGAALAYYSVFSLGPLLLIIISVAGFFFSEAEARDVVMGEIRSAIGETGSRAVEAMLDGASTSGSGVIAAATGGVLLIFAATGVVVQLKDALNTVWEVDETQNSSWRDYGWRYLKALAGVLGLGLFVVAMLVASTVLAALPVPGDSTGLFQVLNFAVSLGVLTLLFAVLFKSFPDADVEWREVWFAAAGTAVLFYAGTQAISWYVGTQSLRSTYGAAASVVVLLIWVYYSAQIVLFGAELSRASALPDPRGQAEGAS